MSTSFFLLSAGYLMLLEQYFVPSFSRYLFGDLGDITGVLGLAVLVAAVCWE
jgi:hypothetical protein